MQQNSGLVRILTIPNFFTFADLSGVPDSQQQQYRQVFFDSGVSYYGGAEVLKRTLGSNVLACDSQYLSRLRGLWPKAVVTTQSIAALPTTEAMLVLRFPLDTAVLFWKWRGIDMETAQTSWQLASGATVKLQSWYRSFYEPGSAHLYLPSSSSQNYPIMLSWLPRYARDTCEILVRLKQMVATW